MANPQKAAKRRNAILLRLQLGWLCTKMNGRPVLIHRITAGNTVLALVPPRRGPRGGEVAL